jgi:hypothetical protein
MTLPHSAIWLIDPISQKLIFSLEIFDKDDRSRFIGRENYLRKHGYPALIRVFCSSFNEIRILANDEEIPVALSPRPIRPGNAADYIPLPGEAR